MRATRRRQRKTDPLASPTAVRSITEKLRSALPDLIPQKEKELVRLLRAARHARRYPATDTKRGRPAKWGREHLLRVAARLGDILGRETQGRVSLNSFIGQYLPVLDFPLDVREPPGSGEINLFEDLSEIMPAVDQITLTLQKIERRKEDGQAKRLTI